MGLIATYFYGLGNTAFQAIDNYDHPIYESGIQLVDMVYLQRPL